LLAGDALHPGAILLADRIRFIRKLNFCWGDGWRLSCFEKTVFVFPRPASAPPVKPDMRLFWP